MMKQAMIPFSPLPTKMLVQFCGRFRGAGARIANTFPYLKMELKQAEIDMDEAEYGAVVLVLFVFWFIAATNIVLLFGLSIFPENVLIAAPTMGGIFALLILMQLSMFPKIKVKKKVRDVERNLIFALRTLLIEIKSGVTLFNAINVVAEGRYGAVSREFSKAIEKINTGTNEEDALEEIAAQNPSLFFRRAMWQLLNGLKTGGDISNAIAAMVDTLAKEQANQVRRYGSSLRLLSVIYMMIGVIIPALGLTFLIILGSFPKIAISEFMFWALLLGIIIGQFMYLGMLKSGRPNLMGE